MTQLKPAIPYYWPWSPPAHDVMQDPHRSLVILPSNHHGTASA